MADVMHLVRARFLYSSYSYDFLFYFNKGVLEQSEITEANSKEGQARTCL